MADQAHAERQEYLSRNGAEANVAKANVAHVERSHPARLQGRDSVVGRWFPLMVRGATGIFVVLILAGCGKTRFRQ
jgi:hypothetical protein